MQIDRAAELVSGVWGQQAGSVRPAKAHTSGQREGTAMWIGGQGICDQQRWRDDGEGGGAVP